MDPLERGVKGQHHSAKENQSQDSESSIHELKLGQVLLMLTISLSSIVGINKMKFQKNI